MFRRFIRAVKAAMREDENTLPIDVRRLSFQDGDTVLIRCTADVTAERMGNIIRSWGEQFPAIKAVVVDQYLDISIVSKFPAVQCSAVRQ